MFTYNFRHWCISLLSLFDPWTQNVSAADGRPQVFHYAKSATQHTGTPEDGRLRPKHFVLKGQIVKVKSCIIDGNCMWTLQYNGMVKYGPVRKLVLLLSHAHSLRGASLIKHRDNFTLTIVAALSKMITRICSKGAYRFYVTHGSFLEYYNALWKWGEICIFCI
jgi:hypothetical protein